MEYSLFSPSLLLSEQNKHRLFEHFWNSKGARVGEDGAFGWSTWLEKEEEQRQKLISEESSHNDEEGGWTGWTEPLSKNKEIDELPEDITDGDMAVEADNESETKEVEQKDETEALLRMLGIDTNAVGNNEIKDTETWTRWSKEELARDCDQWMPVHLGPAQADDDEQLHRVVAYEEVSDYLFSIGSEEARLSLVSQFIDFYGGRIMKWTCTNSSSWVEQTLSLESLPHSFLDDLRRVHEVLSRKESHPISISLERMLDSSDSIAMRSSMMEFLRNVTLLCLTAFPQNYLLQEAALVAEELVNTKMNSSSSSITPCRTLAKSLLKSNRRDILLCGVYARREAVFGNIAHARKVLDMALSSVEGLSLDVQKNASILYLWYAEVELANDSTAYSESTFRALHILSCFGGGAKYSPYKCQPSSLQQLRARQGFKERIKILRSTFARGIVDDYSVAVISSAALFEELTMGWMAGIEILNQAFTMVLPERRRQSHQLEFLFNYYVQMLLRHHAEIKLSELWDSIVKGLHIYPFSPNLYTALVEIGNFYTSPNKVRLIFDDYFHKKPSVVAWLFALSFELSRGAPLHRIRGLFERALDNNRLHNSVILWRCYVAYESNIASDPSAARRVFFRAIHACPWSKKLWLDGFLKLNSILTAKELSDLQEVMRDKELNLRTDIYEILLQDEIES